jgi:hypothetical protein
MIEPLPIESSEQITYSRGHRSFIPARILGAIVSINIEFYNNDTSSERCSYLEAMEEILWNLVIESSVITDEQYSNMKIDRGNVESLARLIGEEKLYEEIPTDITMAGKIRSRAGGRTPSQVFSPRDDVWYGTDIIFIFQK